MNPVNEKTSPLHLSSVLNNLSLDMNPTQQDSLNASYTLKLGNLPKDITLREAYAIFALTNNLVHLELIENHTEETGSIKPEIIAKFNSMDSVVYCAQLLVAKTDVFGPTDPIICHVEVIDNLTNKLVAFQNIQPNGRSSSQFTATGGQITSLPNMNAMIGSNTHPTTSQQHQQQQQQQQQHHHHQQQQQQQQQQGNSSRSQFSFSDPFANSMANQESIQQNQQNASNVNQSHQDISVNTTDVGKSFLLMDNDEINDTIWGPNAIPSSINGLSNTPQPSTPTVEWGNSSSRKQSSAFFLPPASGSVGTPTMPNMDAMAMPKGVQLQGSNNQSQIAPNQTVSSIQPYGMMNQMGSNSNNPPMQNMIDNNEINYPAPQNSQQGNFMNNSPFKGRMSTSQPRNMSDGMVSSSQHGNQINNNASNSNLANGSSNNLVKMNSLTKISSSTPVSKGNNPPSSISQADLSLLARVPPPANPADQNPPCNTLYVGNLPPDATESELRQLFSGQQGFRRLSFRNKNNNGNGHGPMCFVEFDDVSFATRALAELYGSQLPRTTTSNKGGIRLSFSKNPLGVRGPNSRRNMNPSNTPTLGGNPNNSVVPNNNMVGIQNSSVINNTAVPYSYTNNYAKN